jgi:HPt (histidine-containing phosphotransfer) domain-containing protein
MMAESQARTGGPECDPQSALARLGDDHELYREVLQRFFTEAPGFLNRITAAIDPPRAEELHRAAHSFKGLAALAGADEVARTAAELEAQGKASRFDLAPELASRLGQQLQQAAKTLSPHYEG